MAAPSNAIAGPGIAVVTGGAQGIGFATAQRLQRDGFTVVIGDLNGDAAEAAAQRLGSGAVGVQLNVADRDGVFAFFERVSMMDAPLTALVNCAGASIPNMPTWQVPVDAWQRAIEVNLGGVFHCCSAAIPLMLEHGYGRIVNVASIGGKEGNPNSGPYSAAKAGVIGLTKSLGKELALDGVLVNSVAPSVVETDMYAGLSESSREYMLSKIPMQRPGKPDELAALISWLCSRECSFSTGAVYDFSGGRATY